ncbi:MAG: 3-phosphoshikimate 1-carboxyvinyltransferase [Bacteroidota bacterium]
MNKLTINKTQITDKVPFIKVPASKSISNRLLILNALSGNKLTIKNLSDSEDTLLLKKLLEEFMQNKTQLNCQNAGTVFRFLTAFLSFQPGSFYLTGNSAMKSRPVYPLVNAIKRINSHITISYPEKSGYPPLQIHGKELNKEIKTNIDSSISSQFITALLMTGVRHGITLKIEKKPASLSYIQMTLMLLEKLNIHYQFHDDTIILPSQKLQDQEVVVEYDWSSAAPWYVLTSIMQTGYSIQVYGLQEESIQGDQELSQLFSHLGVQTTYHSEYIELRKTARPNIQDLTYDIKNIPDTALYLLTACAANETDLTLNGISHLRYKESDRIKAMQQELSKLGVKLEIRSPDIIKLHSPKSFETKNDITINSHGDHRIAMAFAPLATLIKNLSISEPDTVAKSYPNFWQEFQKCYFQIQ